MLVLLRVQVGWHAHDFAWACLTCCQERRCDPAGGARHAPAKPWACHPYFFGGGSCFIASAPPFGGAAFWALPSLSFLVPRISSSTSAAIRLIAGSGLLAASDS